MEKDMGVNGERWYIYCGGNDGWWRKWDLRCFRCDVVLFDIFYWRCLMGYV